MLLIIKIRSNKGKIAFLIQKAIKIEIPYGESNFYPIKISYKKSHIKQVGPINKSGGKDSKQFNNSPLLFYIA